MRGARGLDQGDFAQLFQVEYHGAVGIGLKSGDEARSPDHFLESVGIAHVKSLEERVVKALIIIRNTAVPTVVPLCETVNVTVPAFTVPDVLVTVAASVTLWLLSLNVAVAFAAVVVVAPLPTVNVGCRCSPQNFPPRCRRP